MKKTTKKKVRTNITIDASLLAFVEHTAKELDMTKGEVVESALERLKHRV